MNAVLAERLADVRAPVLYLEPGFGKPRSLEFEPPPGVLRTTAVFRERTVTIRDMRPNSASLSLDRAGFQLLRAPSAVRDFGDEEAIRARYYPEAAALIQQVTGAQRVVVFDHTIRRRVLGAADRTAGLPRQPAMRVHNDYTHESGPQRVRDLLGHEADALLRRRFSVINLWRPIKGPVEDSPLGLVEAGSVDPADLVATDLVYPDRRGEIYYVRFNPAHRWFYAPAMRTDEVILIKCFDSAQDGRARFVPHSAFTDPTTPAGAAPRESIELRTLVFHA